MVEFKVLRTYYDILLTNISAKPIRRMPSALLLIAEYLLRCLRPQLDGLLSGCPVAVRHGSREGRIKNNEVD